ncbi:hypothetical protein CFOL_v3_35314 [Cephalotus follicularis]|uniref:Uncharacterized protein n=1 Tax=Cephalotus follicularis TaxID=3775 RepID=A0A1Q3DHN8_CEPFO|nr:hypothetical protein CFOL_v3_35314 [Cephalotus follicularis]
MDHRFMRPPPPPPPSTADPYYHHLQQQQQQQQQRQAPPPAAAAPQQGPWYANQFQYHPPASHSPSPPPLPPQSQWAPQPPPPHHLEHSSYPPPPPPPYPAHLLHPPNDNNHNHFPLPHVPYSQIPQAYPNQEWGNPNWSHHQAHGNVEDWAARAKEWAAAKAAMEDQHLQSQYAPFGRSEEQSRFHDQYPQDVNSHYPAATYQQYPASPAPPHRPPLVYPQETASVSSGPPSYVPDGHLAYIVRDGNLAGDSNAGFSHQEALPTSPYVHQQEVPSSYSSVTGKEESSEKMETYTTLPFSTSSAPAGQHYVQSSLPAVGRSLFGEQPFAYGNQAADPMTNLSDQPLDFAPRFNFDHDPYTQSSYASHHDPAGTIRGIDPAATLPSINSWTPPVAPGVTYPPIPSLPSSGPQHDPSQVIPSVSGHAVPPFGRFPESSFPPTIASSGALFGLGAGFGVHPTTAFPGDTYGVTSVSERPKKAAMPNWLKEEIIKNKEAIISKSSLEHPKEETQSIEDDGVDRSIGKGDQADSKSIDSSRSTEEEDDDEDHVEAARTAAINQEIKRVLTEVLLKVTDELFDEIATKVLVEDDLMAEVNHNSLSSNHILSPSPPAVPTSKTAAKILVPVKHKESETQGLTERVSSSLPGDVLGLANYASDDDDPDDGDGENKSSSILNSRENVLQRLSIRKLPDDTDGVTENGSLQVEVNEHSTDHTNLKSDGDHDDDITGDGKLLDGDNVLGSKNTLGEKVIMKSELPGENVSLDDSRGQDTRRKLDKNDQCESKRSYSGTDFVEEVESSRKRADDKGDEDCRKQDEKHLKKEKKDDRNGSKERWKEQSLKPGELANESEARRSTRLDVKDDRKDTEKLRRDSSKEDSDRKRERAKEKEEERSRHKVASESSSHKRRHSPSTSSRGRNSKEKSASHANDSSDEASADSKRKLHSRKRNLSPSPIRTRRRPVSRSPHSKHSQRRHSPYSSLESSRGRRLRSRSPMRPKR